MPSADFGFGAALFDAGLRGFLTAFALLRFAPAVFRRPSFRFFLAIAPPLRHARIAAHAARDPCRTTASRSLSSHRRRAAASSCAALVGVATLHLTKYAPVVVATSGDDAR